MEASLVVQIGEMLLLIYKCGAVMLLVACLLGVTLGPDQNRPK